MTQSKTLSLQASSRTKFGKVVRSLRQQDIVPAVLYGHGLAPVAVSLEKAAFEKLFKQAGENTIVQLAVEQQAPVNVLINDVQYHPTTGVPLHVDFYQVRMDEKITTTVPLEFVGEAMAVKALGGTFVPAMSEVEVESLPADIPHVITVDISKLNTFDDAIYVSDLVVDRNKVTILAEPEQTVAAVEEPRTEEELEALTEAVVEDVSAVEGVVKESDSAEGEAEPEDTDKKEKE